MARPRWHLTVLGAVLLSVAGVSEGCASRHAVVGCNCSTDTDCTSGQVCSACVCMAPCTSDRDCPSTAPSCDTATGHCYTACTSNADCTAPNAPNCDPSSGLCGPKCTGNSDCPTAAPRCNASTGLCGPCTGNADCSGATPNCGSDGACFASCSNTTDCAMHNTNHPNCGSDGKCTGACSTSADCSGTTPNCGSDGVCFAACTNAADCISHNVNFPACDLTSGSATAGQCGPCTDNTDCPADHPNCDTNSGSATFGQCLAPCTTSTDCSSALPNCGSDGVCWAACSSSDACISHNVALPACDLASGSATEGMCGSCIDNTDCPTDHPNCDTDSSSATFGQCLLPCNAGGTCPSGTTCNATSGICESGPAGCTLNDQCSVGQKCDTASGNCVPDDIGAACDNGTKTCSTCNSGQGVDDGNGGKACSRFCCSQHDCPSGWACRMVADNASTLDPSNTYIQDGLLRLCVPLGSHGATPEGGVCNQDSDCRSDVCGTAGHCTDTCCTDAGCSSTGLACLTTTPTDSTGGELVTACLPGPGTTDLGAYADQVGQCSSGLSIDYGFDKTNYAITCSDASMCPSGYDETCGYNDPNSAYDCISHDCLALCCTSSDCAGAQNGTYFCGAADIPNVADGTYHDLDVCLPNVSVSSYYENWSPCTSPGSTNDSGECPNTLICGSGSVCGPRQDAGQPCTHDANCKSLTCTCNSNSCSGQCVARGAAGAPCTSAAQCNSNLCDVNAGVCRERCCTDADCGSGSTCQAELLNVWVWSEDYGASYERLLTVCVPTP